MTIAAVHIDPTAPLVQRLRQAFAEDHLRDVVGHGAERVSEHLWQQALLDALVEFLGRPGKEFRARLVNLAFRLAGGTGSPPQELSWIVEVLHAGSLIVDDIEDDSKSRRGRPALHVLYGVPTALNAGNWLYFWAYDLLKEARLSPRQELRLHRLLTATLLRCHQGQALDLNTRIARLAKREVRNVVETTTRLKTGSLMGLAAGIGALAQRASEAEVTALESFGCRLGTCLQMLDDRSGLFNERRVQKGYEDLIGGRPTWPWAWLAERLDDVRFARLQSQARLVELGQLEPEVVATTMRELLGDGPRLEIRQTLKASLDTLEQTFVGRPVLDEIRAEIARLEQGYE